MSFFSQKICPHRQVFFPAPGGSVYISADPMFFLIRKWEVTIGFSNMARISIYKEGNSPTLFECLVANYLTKPRKLLNPELSNET